MVVGKISRMFALVHDVQSRCTEAYDAPPLHFRARALFSLSRCCMHVSLVSQLITCGHEVCFSQRPLANRNKWHITRCFFVTRCIQQSCTRARLSRHAFELFFRRRVESADAAAGTRHDPPVSVAHGAKSVAPGSAIRAAGRSAHPALEGTTARQSDAAHCRHGSCRSDQAWLPAKFFCIAHLQSAVCFCPDTSIFIVASPFTTVSGLSVHAQCRRNSLFRGNDCHRAITLQFVPRSRVSRCCKSHIGAHRLHSSPGLVAFPLTCIVVLQCREFVCLATVLAVSLCVYYLINKMCKCIARFDFGNDEAQQCQLKPSP
jgi:hypothetical protein